MTDGDPIRVNRAPVLTLWAAVVAERLGHAPDTALSLGSAVAGTAAHAKARRLGLVEDRHRAAGEGQGPGRPDGAVARLLGREIALVETDGLRLALGRDGRPAPAAPVRAYLRRAFGDRLGQVRGAMEGLAARLPAEDLNRIGFRLYEAFRPDVPAGLRGWAAKGELRLERIHAATP